MQLNILNQIVPELVSAQRSVNPTSPQISAARLALISHLPCQLSGGGMFAVTWHIWRQLRQWFPESCFQQVPTPGNWGGMLRSRIRRRLLGQRGDFFTFAPHVLIETSRRVQASVPAGTQALLFRSSTRWVRCRPEIPYFVHTDACFHTYCRNKHAEGEFACDDLRRIWDEERAFLEAAAGVFFESHWALEQARAAYELRGSHYYTVGVAGGMELPRQAAPATAVTRLISIANNFRQKGGDLTFAAFKLLQPRFPQLQWHIVGGRPDYGVSRWPGIVYEGFLNIDSQADLLRYAALMNETSLLIHPTREDMNPLVLIEAAGYGCPAVSVQDFAIPELVTHGETGLLLPRPVTPESLAAAIETLICDPLRYQQMRASARERALKQFSWDVVGTRMATLINDILGHGQ